MDSRASIHMTHNSSILTNLKHYNEPDKIINGNESKLDITHVENILRWGLKLKEVLVVAKINKNSSQLVSLQRIIIALLNLMKMNLL